MQYFLQTTLFKNIFLSESLVKRLLKIFSVFTIIFFLANAPLAFDDRSPLASQLKIRWQYTSSELTGMTPIISQDRVFLTESAGKITALNFASGETLWRTELGGEIIGQTPVEDNLIYVASQVASTNNQASLTIIRALSAETGLTIWQGELPAALQISLVVNKNTLLIAINESESSGKIFALAADRGNLLWTQKLTTPFSTLLTLTNNSIVFAQTDQTIYILDLANGAIIKSARLSHPAQAKIVFEKGVLLFGDAAGNVSAMRETDNKILWKMRLGGAAENIVSAEANVVISSLDDFVYFHNILTGKRLWKKRLASRPLGAVLLPDASLLVTTTGDNNSTLLSLKKGKNLSQLSLGIETIAIAKPIVAGQTVLIPTNKGLLAFAPG